MNLFIYNTDFNVSNVYFLDKKTNMIMDGIFTKIMYSNSYMIMNGIYIDIPLRNCFPIKKNVLQLDIPNNKEILQRLIDIEKQILFYYTQFFISSQNAFLPNKDKPKIPVFNLKSQIQSGLIKYYKDADMVDNSRTPRPLRSSSGFYIKISGIWENQTEMGITFKLVEF